jgi:hypothetical protein
MVSEVALSCASYNIVEGGVCNVVPGAPSAYNIAACGVYNFVPGAS